MPLPSFIFRTSSSTVRRVLRAPHFLPALHFARATLLSARLSLGALSFSALSLAVATPCMAASSEDTAGARAIAKQGFEAFQKEDFEKALDLFTRAEHLHHATTHLLFAARCHLKLGHPVEAFELYNRIIREELDDKAPAAFLDAQSAAKEEIVGLEEQIAYVTIEVEGSAEKLFVDGKEVSTALLGVEGPVNPGVHQFEVRGQGTASESVSHEFTAGEHASIPLVLVAAPGEPEPVASDGTLSEPASKSSRAPAYALLGVGAVGVVVGTVFTIQHFSKKSASNKLFEDNDCAVSCSSAEKAAVEAKDKKAATAGTVGLIGYGIGAAGLAAGVTLLLTSGGGSESAEKVGARPYFGWGEVGLTGKF